MQLLLGLSAMLIATFLLAGLIVEQMVAQRLFEARRALAASHAAAVAYVHPDAADLGEFVRATGVAGAAWTDGERTTAVPPEIAQLTGEAGSESTRMHGRNVLIARREEAGVRATVVVGLADVEARIADTRRVVWTFFGLVAIVVLLFGYAFFTMVVMRPIRAIRIATERASSGDLASQITIQPRNEYGEVALSFNAMLARLDDNRATLQRRLDELEEANRELRRTRDSLVRSEKLASVGQLSAGVAHEIGNPLAAISGYNELLREGDLDPEDEQDLLERTANQLERIRGIIRNLLDFSREGEGAVGPTDLQRCVEECCSLVGALPSARSVSIEAGDLSGPPVKAIAEQVVQVLVNLCVNALDALSDTAEPRLVISRGGDGSTTTLSVADNGPGIPAGLQSRVFDPFFTTKEPGAGTGLGLAISSRIMESFGGSIELTSGDEGTTFLLNFENAFAAHDHEGTTA